MEEMTSGGTGFDANLEKKLQVVNSTQDSIQSFSLWLLHHRARHSRIAQLWLKVLKKSKIPHRLTLIYLANDVVQNSKRKASLQPFVDSFRDVMKEAALLSRDEKIRPSVERVFNIWAERNIYEEDYIKELQDILVNSKVSVATTSKIISEFECQKLTNKIKEIQNLETKNISLDTSVASVSKLDLSPDPLLRKLKDRSHGMSCTAEYDEAAKSLETAIAGLEKEHEERTALLENLEQADLYYGSMRREVKGVSNAYKNFAARIQNVKAKLDELKSKFEVKASPSPSDMDIPSPSNSPQPPIFDSAPPGVKEVGKLLDESIEVPSPDAVPSPEGSPIGLSPKATSSSLKGEAPPAGMSSWLGSFIPTPSSSNSNSATKQDSSLESRLSNFRHSFEGVKDNPFGKDSPFGLSNSPVPSYVKSPPSHTPPQKETSMASAIPSHVTIPSGHNTPLQDEDFSLPTMSSFLQENDTLSTLTAIISQPPPPPDTLVVKQPNSFTELLEKVAGFTKKLPQTNNITLVSSDSPLGGNTPLGSSVHVREDLELDANSQEVPLGLQKTSAQSCLVTLTGNDTPEQRNIMDESSNQSDPFGLLPWESGTAASLPTFPPPPAPPDNSGLFSSGKDMDYRIFNQPPPPPPPPVQNSVVTCNQNGNGLLSPSSQLPKQELPPSTMTPSWPRESYNSWNTAPPPPLPPPQISSPPSWPAPPPPTFTTTRPPQNWPPPWQARPSLPPRLPSSRNYAPPPRWNSYSSPPPKRFALGPRPRWRGSYNNY